MWRLLDEHHDVEKGLEDVGDDEDDVSAGRVVNSKVGACESSATPF